MSPIRSAHIHMNPVVLAAEPAVSKAATVRRKEPVPAALRKAINIEDLRLLAKARLPRFAFDFIEGGAEDENALARNEASFQRFRLLPRFLVDVRQRSQALTPLGRRFSSPFGIAPTGMTGLFRPGADAMLLQAAVDADIPFVMSGASTTITLEEAAAVSREHVWYQLYAMGEQRVSDDIIDRCAHAGLQTLVLTVDTQHGAKRERNLRNGFSREITLRTLAAALTRPRWAAGVLRHGMPVFSNYARYAGPQAGARETAKFMASLDKSPQTWTQFEQYRRRWAGKLVIKGVLHPEDARRAVELGADGIIVSNHGGRQLDRAPAPLEALPAIRAAVGDRARVMIDSGLRRGADIVTALALGADFCFVGRPTLYGVVAGGLPGAQRAIGILRDEVDLVLGQIGCPDITRLDDSWLMVP